MKPDDPRLDEEWPTGTFGHALPPPEPPPRPATPWTPEEQAQHVTELLNGIHGWHYAEPDPEEATHLRLVDDETDAA